MIIEIDDIHISNMINYTKTSLEGVIYQYYKIQDNEIAYLFLMELNKNNLVIKVNSLNNLNLWLELLSKYPSKTNKKIIFKFDKIDAFALYDIINKYKDKICYKNIILDINNCSYSLEKFLLYMDIFKQKRPKSELEIITLIYDNLKECIINREQSFFDIKRNNKIKSSNTAVDYIKIFKEILQLFNIKSYPYSFNGRLENSNLIKNVEHNILLINIEDDIYGLQGIYFFDLYIDGKKETMEDNRNQYKGFLLSYKEFANRYYVENDFSKKILYKEKYTLLSNLNKYNSLSREKERSINEDRYKDNLIVCYRLDDVAFCLLNESTDIFSNDNVYEMMRKVYTLAIKLFDKFGAEISMDDVRLMNLFINLYGESKCIDDISKSIISRSKRTITGEQLKVVEDYSKKLLNRKKALFL